MDNEYAVVLDAGSSSVKAGYSGEDSPKVVVQAPLTLSEQNAVSGIVQRGRISDLSKFQESVEGILETELIINSKGSEDATSVGICMTMPEHSEHRDREDLATMFFEHFDVPSLCFCHSSMTSLLASGRVSGLVLEVGAACTHSVPVFEGLALKHAALTSFCGGLDVTRVLQTALASSGHDLAFSVVNSIKESLCYVQTSDASSIVSERRSFELPDGTLLELSPSKCHLPGELLFNPTMHAAKYNQLSDMQSDGPIQELAKESLSSCELQLRRALAQNVVLAGGATMMPGFIERASQSIADAVADIAHLEAQVFPDGRGMQRSRGYNSQRQFAAWTGASMLASLSTYKDIRISKAAWEENPDIVHRKLI